MYLSEKIAVLDKLGSSVSYSSNFQAFSSHGTQKLITKILQHTKNIYIFADLKKIGVLLIHLRWTASVVLVVVIF